jgi:hypothetical protein
VVNIAFKNTTRLPAEIVFYDVAGKEIFQSTINNKRRDYFIK